MDEQTIFFIFFILIVISFIYGNKHFYQHSLKIKFFDVDNYDDVFFKLISLGLISIVCAFYWNYYTSNYVNNYSYP